MAAGTADWPPVKNVAFTFHWHTPTSQADPTILQANPTLASGDVKVSLDGGNFANIGTLPTVVNSGKSLEIVLSQTEMNSNNIVIIFSDAAGAEWCDMAIEIFTVTRQLLNLAFPATSGRSMVVDAAGLVDANVVKIGPTGSGTAQTARDIGASVLLSTGTGTGQLDFTSGVVKANIVQLLATAFTESSAGRLVAGIKKFFDVATPASTMELITAVTTTTTATNLTNAPTAGDFTSTMKTSLNAATPAVTVSDKTGFSLSSAGIQAIWDKVTSSLTAGGSIGKLLVDNLNTTVQAVIDEVVYVEGVLGSPTTGTIASDIDNVKGIAFTTFNRVGTPVGADLSHDIAAVKTVVDAIKAKTDQIVFTVANRIDSTVSGITAGLIAASHFASQAEPGQGAPPATTDPLTKLAYVYKAWRNRTTQTASQYTLYADNATTVDQKATFSDDGSTADRGEVASGP